MAQTLFSIERKEGKILIFIETVDTNKKINILNSLYSSSEKVCFVFLEKKSISLSGIVGFSSHTYIIWKTRPNGPQKTVQF